MTVWGVVILYAAATPPEGFLTCTSCLWPALPVFNQHFLSLTRENTAHTLGTVRQKIWRFWLSWLFHIAVYLEHGYHPMPRHHHPGELTGTLGPTTSYRSHQSCNYSPILTTISTDVKTGHRTEPIRGGIHGQYGGFGWVGHFCQKINK